MLEHLQDLKEASYLVTDLATQIITENADVTAKLQYVDRLVRHADQPIKAEDAQRKEGLLKRISLLATFLKGSISKSGVIDYTYDSDRMEELDKVRHAFAHWGKKEYTIEAASSDIRYLYLTALHFLDLTVHRY